MVRLQNIYNNLKDEKEFAIYDKYGKIAKRITIAFISKKKRVDSWYYDHLLISILQ